jgi:hypothetical protein
VLGPAPLMRFETSPGQRNSRPPERRAALARRRATSPQRSRNFSGTQFVLSSDGISGTDITLANLVSVPSGWTLTVSSGQTSGVCSS